MHHPVGPKALRFVLPLLLVLAFLPLEAAARKGPVNDDPEDAPYSIYLPTVFKDAAFAPDLVIEAITVYADSAVVVIKNQGFTEVAPDNSFWVDLYVAPDPMPTGPNEVWDRVSAQGIVWGVGSKGLPLSAGETLTLTYCSEPKPHGLYYDDKYSTFVDPLAAGTQIAVQVDSANVSTTYGAVLEGHEIQGKAYNNISTTVSIVGSGCEEAPEEPPADLLPLVQSDGLPPRPHHTE